MKVGDAMAKYLMGWALFLTVLVGGWVDIASAGTMILRGSTAGGSVPAFRSYADSADGTVSGVGSISTTTNLTVSAGDAIVAFVAKDNSGIINSVTCGSNSLTQAKVYYNSTDAYYYEAWVGLNMGAYTGTCTATFSVSYVSWSSIQAASYSGIATSSAIDQTACNSASCDALASSSANITTQNVTTTVANELLVVGALAWNNDVEYTGANGYTPRRAGSTRLHNIIDKTVSSTGTYPSATVATIGTADSYISILLTLKGL